MCVILLMAILALSRRVAPWDLGLVAFSARHGYVATIQGIIGQRMIERGIAQSENIRVAAFVIRMATIALTRRGQRALTVETQAVRQISSNLLVTGQTERALRPCVEGLMAGRTVLRELLMVGGQGAGHHHTFPIDRERRFSRNERHATCDDREHDSVE